MKTKSPAHVWNSVLEATEDIGRDEIKAARILLYILLLGASGITVRDRLRCFRCLWRHLALPFRHRLPESAKGNPLFAFVYNTAAHSNNLVPVFQAARKTWDGIGVLTGDTVTISSLGLNHADSHIGVAGLVARTTAKERFNALLESVRLYRLLLDKFAQRDAHQAATIRVHRVRILTDLALSLALRPALRRLYAKWEPSCLISTTDLWPFEHTVFAEARRAKIPSFVIQHGVPNFYWHPSECDTLLLWGEPFRQQLLNWGAPPERLAVCGMPAADHWFCCSGGKTTKPSFQQAFSVLLLSETNVRGLMPHMFEKYTALLREVIPTASGVKWLVKLHPSEDDSFYRKIGDDVLRHLTILPKSTTLEQAVTGADVACTLFSTAGLEAMMMGRPLVVFDVDPAVSEYAWWPKQGGGVYVSTGDAMNDFITRAKEGASFLNEIVALQYNFLQRTFANRGTAAETVVSFVSQRVGKARPPQSVN
jgi:hypothetical protein